ncbi:MAG: hypothetical protein MEQ07_00650 [Aquimonas sp.]|nr:hypothetical protein [Aquimonas sp.]
MRRAAILALTCVLTACTPGEPHVDVEYRHLGEPASASLELFLQAGKDRHRHAQLGPGQSGRVRLIPGVAVVRADERRLHLRYTLTDSPDAEPVHWPGPDLPASASYRIRIELDGDGRVESHHCIKPCSLEQ